MQKKWLKCTKVAMLAVVAGLMAPAAVWATSANMGATATFLSAITLTPTNMQFGKITFGATPGASDTVVLTTAGGITYNGTFGSGGASTVAAGDVAIGGTAGSVLDVSCGTSAVMASAGAARITVNALKVAKESAAGAGGVACAGTGTVVLSFTLTATTDDQLKVGGTIDGATQVSFAAGAYSTATSGGSNATINVVYQ